MTPHPESSAVLDAVRVGLLAGELGHRLFEEARVPKRLVTLEGVGHNDVLFKEKSRLMEELGTFFDFALGAGGPGPSLRRSQRASAHSCGVVGGRRVSGRHTNHTQRLERANSRIDAGVGTMPLSSRSSRAAVCAGPVSSGSRLPPIDARCPGATTWSGPRNWSNTHS